MYIYLWFLVSSVDRQNIIWRFIYSRIFPFHFHHHCFLFHYRQSMYFAFLRDTLADKKSRFSLRSISVQPAVDVSVKVFWINVWLSFISQQLLLVINVLLWVFCLFHFQRFLIFGLLNTVIYLPRFTGLISTICRQRVSDTSSTVPIFTNGFYNFLEIAAQIDI